jgi:hypothetical protein
LKEQLLKKDESTKAATKSTGMVAHRKLKLKLLAREFETTASHFI